MKNKHENKPALGVIVGGEAWAEAQHRILEMQDEIARLEHEKAALVRQVDFLEATIRKGPKALHELDRFAEWWSGRDDCRMPKDSLHSIIDKFRRSML